MRFSEGPARRDQLPHLTPIEHIKPLSIERTQSFCWHNGRWGDYTQTRRRRRHYVVCNFHSCPPTLKQCVFCCMAMKNDFTLVAPVQPVAAALPAACDLSTRVRAKLRPTPWPPECPAGCTTWSWTRPSSTATATPADLFTGSCAPSASYFACCSSCCPRSSRPPSDARTTKPSDARCRCWSRSAPGWTPLTWPCARSDSIFPCNLRQPKALSGQSRFLLRIVLARMWKRCQVANE